MKKTNPRAAQVSALRREVRAIHSEVHQLRRLVEDSLLTADEAQFLDETIAKIKRGDRSDFVELDQESA